MDSFHKQHKPVFFSTKYVYPVPMWVEILLTYILHGHYSQANNLPDGVLGVAEMRLLFDERSRSLEDFSVNQRAKIRRAELAFLKINNSTPLPNRVELLTQLIMIDRRFTEGLKVYLSSPFSSATSKLIKVLDALQVYRSEEHPNFVSSHVLVESLRHYNRWVSERKIKDELESHLPFINLSPQTGYLYEVKNKPQDEDYWKSIDERWVHLSRLRCEKLLSR